MCPVRFWVLNVRLTEIEKARGLDFKDKETLQAIDKHVGQRLRDLRRHHALSQQKLGNHLGISFQQVQKYENGTNRIGASRLYAISKTFRVSLNYFFRNL